MGHPAKTARHGAPDTGTRVAAGVSSTRGATLTAAKQIIVSDRNLRTSLVFNRANPYRPLRYRKWSESLMKTDCRIAVSRMSWTCLVLLVLAFSLPALAALGGDVTSVHEDQAQMK